MDLLPATGLLARLGATIPVVAAPMAGGPSTSDLVTATAKAGGFGFVAGGYLSTDVLAQHIAEVRTHEVPFGVNLFVPNPVPVDREAFAEYAAALGQQPVEPREDDDEWSAKVDLLVADPVPVVSFTFGIPQADVIARLRSAGTVTLQTITTADEARQAAAAGVDGLIVQGSLAGGHSATTTPQAPIADVPLSMLVSTIRAAVDLPVWAAGGVATYAQVRHLLVAGAEAVVVGTALLRTPESGTSQTYRDALVDPLREDTLLTRAFTGRPARSLTNACVRKFTTIAPLGYPAVHHLTAPLRRAATDAGDPEAISLWAGSGYRLATDEPAAVVIGRLAGAPEPLVVAAVAFVRDGAVLTVRKEGTHRFMLVGGKFEPGESAAACAVRETREEVGLEITEPELIGDFLADAANEQGHLVRSTVFVADLPDPAVEPVASGEIAQVRWIDMTRAAAGDYDDLAPLLEHHVLPVLASRAAASVPQP